MKILALEFSSDHRSVAVVSGLSETRTVRSVVSENGARASDAFALIAAALGEAKLAREEVECVAVGLGPGSYMGIRVAIALAQGWQLARPIELLGLSSALAVAGQAGEEGRRGRVHVAINAQRNEVYLAEYEIKEGEVTEVQPLRLAPMTEAQSLAAGNQVVIGPDAEEWCKLGRTVFPSAIHLALLAAGRSDFVAGEMLEPIYLRPVSFVKAPPPRQLPL